MVPPPDTTLSPGAFKDRKIGLVIFGTLTILMGGFCALMLPLMLWSQSLAARSGVAQDMNVMLPVMLIYGVIAVGLVWLGIGSIMARRWARALLLIFSWMWLVFGVLDMGIMSYMVPRTTVAAEVPVPAAHAATPESNDTITGSGTDKDPTTYNFHASTAAVSTAELNPIVAIIVLSMMGVILVLLPAIWVFFYRSRHVKATCEAHDPVVRWTDCCPLPVIAVCLWFAWCAVMMIMMPMASKGVVPAFGTFVVGPLGSAIYVLFAVLWGYGAWAMYRLDRRGWWIVFISMMLALASTYLTYSRHDLAELYRLMGYRQEMIDQVQRLGFFNRQTVSRGVLLSAMPFLGYLLWVRKYFGTEAREG